MIKCPKQREKLAVDCWQSLCNAVDSIMGGGGVGSSLGYSVRDTDAWEDAFSEACLGFVKGLNSYPDNCDAAPITWCIVCAKNKVKTWLTKTKRWSFNEVSWEKAIQKDDDLEYLSVEDYYSGGTHNSKSNILPMGYLRWWDDSEIANPECEVIRKEHLLKALVKMCGVRDNSDKMDKKIIDKYYLGDADTYTDLEDSCKISRQAISKRVKNIKEQLK